MTSILPNSGDHSALKLRRSSPFFLSLSLSLLSLSKALRRSISSATPTTSILPNYGDLSPLKLRRSSPFFLSLSLLSLSKVLRRSLSSTNPTTSILPNSGDLSPLKLRREVVIFLTSVGFVLISALLIGLAVVCTHGAFRGPEDLFLDEQEPASVGFLSFLGGAASNVASAAAPVVVGRI